MHYSDVLIQVIVCSATREAMGNSLSPRRSVDIEENIYTSSTTTLNIKASYYIWKNMYSPQSSNFWYTVLCLENSQIFWRSISGWPSTVDLSLTQDGMRFVASTTFTTLPASMFALSSWIRMKNISPNLKGQRTNKLETLEVIYSSKVEYWKPLIWLLLLWDLSHHCKHLKSVSVS